MGSRSRRKGGFASEGGTNGAAGHTIAASRASKAAASDFLIGNDISLAGNNAIFTVRDKRTLQPGTGFCESPGMEANCNEMITREEVMFFDTDCGGVVHNLAYLRMIETCRTRLAATLGMDLRSMAETGIYPVLTRTEANYRKPAKLGDWIEIRGKLGEVGAARFWCEFEMWREDDGVLLVTARQALALVKMPEGKPLRLPIGFGVVRRSEDANG
jgi:YbgC/YbaW family acyl-CoA thioester hydrolase